MDRLQYFIRSKRRTKQLGTLYYSPIHGNQIRSKAFIKKNESIAIIIVNQRNNDKNLNIQLKI